VLAPQIPVVLHPDFDPFVQAGLFDPQAGQIGLCGAQCDAHHQAP
jgi:hypothetical protein